MNSIIERMIALASEIQQIPAPTFHESERAQAIENLFVKEKLTEVNRDSIDNVFGCLPGGSGPPLVVSAHLDTVFPMDTSLKLKRQKGRIIGPGIGDNSIAIAALFGILWSLKHHKVRLPGPLWLVANTGEEGLGDLRGMKAVVERFGSIPSAYLVLEGMAYGQIYHRGLAVRRYLITAHTQGGHSWVNFGRPSAIHALAALVVQLTKIHLPTSPRTTLNVGVINGGTSVNSIASQASLQLDIRSEEPQALQEIIDRVEAMVPAFFSEGVRFDMEIIGDRPGGEIEPDHPLVDLAVRVLRFQGIQGRLNIGSTDANVPLSLGYPAICIGLTTGGDAHTEKEFILTKHLEKGLAQVVDIIGRAGNELASTS